MTRSTIIRLATSLFLVASLLTDIAATARAAPLHDGPSGDTVPVAARTATGAPGSGLHSLGFVATPGHAGAAVRAETVAAAVPTSVDLSRYAPPVGDQGSVKSCTAWATGYYLRGWYATRDGYYPAGGSGNTGSFAPMYTYSQIVRGQNIGTSFTDNLNIQQGQGVDSRADYRPGDYDFTTQPNSGEIANATNVKVASYTTVEGPAGFFGGPLQSYIQSKLAGGDPIVLSIPVYPEFDHASATQYLVTAPQAGEVSLGLHAVAAFKYDANGVWIENQWGTGWGVNGWAELSWDFINRYSVEAVSIMPLSPFKRFFNALTSTHWVTTAVSAVTSGYHYEATLGRLFPTPQGNTIALYDCVASATSNDHFVSLDSGCEGRVRLGVEGYIYSSWQLLTPTVQLYRCFRIVGGHGDHFVSSDAHCEGYTTEATLGYSRT